jgi:protein SCO1/2
VDTLLLYCYHYDPTTGKYGLAAMRAVQGGGLLVVAAMVTFWIAMWRRSRRTPPLEGTPQRA